MQASRKAPTLSSTDAGMTVPGSRAASSSAAALFDRVTPNMKIYKEEIFGPVLAVTRAPDYETAARLINEHEFGNGTAIFTRDGDAAREFAHQIQVGHGRYQRADPGTDGVSFVRRLEGLAVRRPPHAWPRRRALLHATEDDHEPLADRHPGWSRLRHADDALTGCAASAAGQ